MFIWYYYVVVKGVATLWLFLFVWMLLGVVGIFNFA
jgi:hypothetical protein